LDEGIVRIEMQVGKNAAGLPLTARQRASQLTDPENSASRWLRRGVGSKIVSTIDTKCLE